MGSRNADRSAATVSIRMNGVDIGYILSEVTLYQKPGHHDIAVVRAQIPTTYVPFPNGTPVQITYGRPPKNVDNFYGYLHHIEYSVVEQQSAHRIVHLVFVGTSLPMKNGTVRSYVGTSASFVARDMAREYRFQAIVDKHSRVWSALAAGGKSDWEFLADLACSVGYMCWVNKTTLYFVDPLRTLRSARDDVVVFHQTTNRTQYDTLHKFDLVLGDIVPDGGVVARRIMDTLDVRNGNVVRSTLSHTLYDGPQDVIGQGPQINRFIAGHSADSVEEAKYELTAEHLNNVHWVQATVQVDGMPSVRQGSVVALAGDAMLSDHRGRWLVREAVHRFSLPHPTGAWTYLADLTLGRDQAYGVTSRPGSDWPSPQVDTGSRLIDGRWVATRMVGVT